jgi:hypothetical protein
MRRNFLIAVVACIVVAVFSLMGCGSSNKKTWTGGEVKAGATEFGQIAADNGVVYAAFSDSTVADKLTVMKNDGSGWVTAGTAGFSTGYVNTQYLSICVDSSTGIPYVAFDDSGTSLRVMKFSNNTWTDVGTLGTIGPSGKVYLSASNGTLYLAFFDYTNGLSVKSFATAWTNLTGISSTQYGYMAFTVYNGTPYLALNDDTNDHVRLMRYSGGWSEVSRFTSGITIGEDWGQSLVGSDGALYLFFNKYPSYPGDVVVLKWNGTVGANMTSVGTLGSIWGGTTYVEYVSGTVYKGVPYVAYDFEDRDSETVPDAATVKKFNGTTWEAYGDYPDSCDIEDTLLVSDPSKGHLYFQYTDCNYTMTVKISG